MANLWYILNAEKNKELAAKAFCNKHELECYLPMVLKKVSVGFKMFIEKKEVLFPSFLFVKTSNSNLELLISSASIKSLMYLCDEPATITGDEIEALKSYLQKNQMVEAEKIPITSTRNLLQSGSDSKSQTTTNDLLILHSIGYMLKASESSN